jgi:3-oxoacyl-[acyl-carrier protein] reductase
LNNFLNKNCFISGATGGLGTEIAKTLLANGCNLFLTAKSRQKLIRLKQVLEDHNETSSKIYFYEGDLSKLKDISKITTQAKNKLGTIDILINSAGIFLSKPIVQTSLDEYEKVFDINIRAPFLFCKEFSKYMIKKKWGRIVNIGSSSSYQGFKNGSVYCSSKHSLLGLSRTLHAELKEHGIRTFCISPGSIKTRMGKLSKDQDFDTFLDPVEVAKYVEFVISFDKELISEEIRLNRINL